MNGFDYIYEANHKVYIWSMNYMYKLPPHWHGMYGIIIQLFLLHIYLRYTSCNLHVNQTFTRTDPGSFGSQKHYQSVTLSRGKVTCGAICGHCFSCVGIGIAESDVVNCFLIFRNSTLNCLSTDRMTPTAPFQTLDSVIYFILEKGEYDFHIYNIR